jgi:ribosomal protein S18
MKVVLRRKFIAISAYLKAQRTQFKDIAQVTEHLTNKCGALSSNSHTAKNKKNQRALKLVTYCCTPRF